MVKMLLLSTGRQLRPGVDYFWIQRNGAHPGNLAFVPGYHTDRFIVITVDLKPFTTRQVEKSQHVTTRERGNKRFLRVDVRRIGIGHRHHGWRWRRRNDCATIESPSLLA